MNIDPNEAHLDALSEGYDSVQHARAAARDRREAGADGDETYGQELLEDSCFGVPQSFEKQNERVHP